MVCGRTAELAIRGRCTPISALYLGILGRGGAAGDFLRPDDARGRCDLGMLVGRACEGVQAVHEMVKQVPWLRLREPFTIPPGSKYMLQILY